MHFSSAACGRWQVGPAFPLSALLSLISLFLVFISRAPELSFSAREVRSEGAGDDHRRHVHVLRVSLPVHSVCACNLPKGHIFCDGSSFIYFLGASHLTGKWEGRRCFVHPPAINGVARYHSSSLHTWRFPFTALRQSCAFLWNSHRAFKRPYGGARHLNSRMNVCISGIESMRGVLSSLSCSHALK